MAGKPINAKAETVATLPMFRDAYRLRRCILPIDNFFEWKAVKGAKAKQPYAIAMQDRQPFGVAAIWENWKHPGTQDWVRTFADHLSRQQQVGTIQTTCQSSCLPPRLAITRML